MKSLILLVYEIIDFLVYEIVDFLVKDNFL